PGRTRTARTWPRSLACDAAGCNGVPPSKRAVFGLRTGLVACPGRRLASMRILLAEDDRQLRLSIARGLREASYAVDQAGTGPQALALATSNPYDAVILDVLLPGKSGIEVCSELRETGSAVPILILTALDGVDQGM